jgi:hypothetical protein
MCSQGDTIDSLVDKVYGNLGRFTDSKSRNEHIIQRAILTPLNEDVDSINTAIMNWFDLTTPDDPQHSAARTIALILLCKANIEGFTPPSF